MCAPTTASTRTVAVESEDAEQVLARAPGPRPRRPAQRQLRPGPQGAGQVRCRALRGHRRRHQLREVPRRRAGRGRRLADRGRPSRGHAARRRAARVRPARARSRWPGPSPRSPRWPRRPRRCGWRRSPRSGRPGLRIATNARDFVRRRGGALLASTSRSSRGRTRPGSPTWPRSPASGSPAGSRVVFDTGGGSSQFTFGDGEPGRRSGSASRSAPCGSPSSSAWTAPVSDEVLAAALAAIERGPRTPGGPAVAGHPRRHGRGR